MPKNNHYDKKIFRFMFILNALDRGNDVYTVDLAQEFNVNVRTVQRDIELLCQVGFPIYSTVKGRYRFSQDFSLKKVMISQEESSLIAMLKDVTSSLGGKFDTAFKVLSNKLLPPHKDLYALKFGRPIKLSKTLPFMPALEKAMAQKKMVKIHYTKGDQIKFHIGAPLKFMFMAGTWYLAFARDDHKLIKFRLDNIESIDPLKETYTPDAKMQEALDGMDSPWYGADGQQTAKLRIAGEVKHYFKERQFFPYQKILKDAVNGDLTVSTTYGRKMEIVPTILEWMPHIHVMSPPELKEAVDKRVQEYLNQK